jgi:hypothetical protein
VQQLKAVGKICGQRVQINMLLAGVEVYVARTESLKLLRYSPAITALVLAAIGASTLHWTVGTGNLSATIVLYLLVWTLFSAVLSLYIFLGALGSIRGKTTDLEKLDPTILKVTISWKYMEPIAALCLILLVVMSRLHM